MIDEAVGNCDVFLALTGRRWLTAKDENRARRLDDPDDYVRLEITNALQRPDILVIPVLVENARMPSADKLPADIAGLARRNALRLSDIGWVDEVENLIDAIRPAVVQAPPPPPPPPSPSRPPSAPAGGALPPPVSSTPSPDVRRSRLTAIAIAAVATLAVLVLIGVLAGGGGGGGDEGGDGGDGGDGGTGGSGVALELAYTAEPLNPDQVSDGNTHEVTIHVQSPDGELPPISQVTYTEPETGSSATGSNSEDGFAVSFPAAGTFEIVAEVHLADGSVEEVRTTVSV